MEFLGDLMVGAHHRHRLGSFKADFLNRRPRSFGEVVLRLLGITDLVVPQLKPHRAPRPAFVV
jgi:hypothetical protein